MSVIQYDINEETAAHSLHVQSGIKGFSSNLYVSFEITCFLEYNLDRFATSHDLTIYIWTCIAFPEQTLIFPIRTNYTMSYQHIGILDQPATQTHSYSSKMAGPCDSSLLL